nr:hypothetical protein [Lederbergia citrea]
MPLFFAVSARLKQIAFTPAPASLTECIQFFLPITFGWMAFSPGLFRSQSGHQIKMHLSATVEWLLVAESIILPVASEAPVVKDPYFLFVFGPLEIAVI